MTIEIRAIAEDELDRYIDAVRTGFGGDRGQGEEDRVREVIGLNRTHAAFDRDRIVGTMACYGLALGVPGGGDVKAAGLSRVTVAATHRRRGILGLLMETHLADARQHGEAVGCLWASEPAIYGRFGYGVASDNVGIDIDTAAAGITAPDSPDTVTMIDVAEAGTVLPPLHEQLRRQRPGLYARSERWWTYRTLVDHEFMRQGASTMRHVVAHRDGEPVGYVLYRQKASWDDDARPTGTVNVVELLAADPTAEHTLWSYLSGIDLFTTVSAWSQPADGLVPHLAANPRAVRRRTNDGLFVRLIDVVAALTARRYDCADDLVIGVTGPRAGDHSVHGTYRLITEADGTATCERTEGSADVVVDAEALGSVYLGSADTGSLAGLQTRGLLTGRPAAVDRFRRCMAWPVAPWCNEEF